MRRGQRPPRGDASEYLQSLLRAMTRNRIALDRIAEHLGVPPVTEAEVDAALVAERRGGKPRFTPAGERE